MTLLIKNLLFTVVIPGSVAVYVPLWLAGGRTPVGGPWRVVAVGWFAVGSAVYAWTVWDFASYGRGTPAPVDAPKQLVVRGLYRLIRNPMYVGVLSVLIGQVVLFRSRAIALYALAVFLGFHSWTVLYEEPRLAREFGPAYAEYCRHVGRWLPRLRRERTPRERSG